MDLNCEWILKTIRGVKKLKKKKKEGITHNEGKHHCMNHLLVILYVYGIE